MNKMKRTVNPNWRVLSMSFLILVTLVTGCQFHDNKKNEPVVTAVDKPDLIKLSTEALTAFLKTYHIEFLEYNDATHILKIDITKLDFNRYDDLEKLAMLMQKIRIEMNENRLYVIGINHDELTLNPTAFEFDLKGNRSLLKKGENVRFSGKLSRFKDSKAIYALQENVFKANKLNVNDAGVCRLWSNTSGKLFIGFGAKNEPEKFVTTLDGNSSFITNLSGELLDSRTLEPVEEEINSSENQSVLYANGENNCAVIYHSNINMIEWVDLLNGGRILLNASVLGENIDMNSLKSVDKNEKRYMILKVHNLKPFDCVISVPMNQVGEMEIGKLSIEREGLKVHESEIKGLVIREE